MARTSPLDGKLVTLIGGNGFIGSHVAQDLLERGARVRIAAREPEKAFKLKPLANLGQLQFARCNALDKRSIEACVKGSDAVVYLIGAFDGNQQALQADGAGHAARAASETGATSFVYISAIGADPDSPSDYGRTKALGERAVLETDPDAVIIRPSIVFGPEDDFFNRFANMARFSPFLPLIGGGHTRFQPVYVADVAEAYARSVDGALEGGRIYELGGPEVLSFRECLEEMLEATYRKRWLVPVPWFVARIQGRILGMLPKPLLTLDQVKLLEVDNVVSDEARDAGRTLPGLGIQQHSLAAILPMYLWRYRPAGQFTRKQFL